MRKRLLLFVIGFALCTAVFPLEAAASGGYCVIKGEKVYHSVFCSETWGYNIEDMKWYKTIKEVERTGYNPCEYCADAMFDYEEDVSTRWFSKDDKIQNALEMERFMGVMDSAELLEEECDAAYQEGFETGKSVGYDEGYNAGFDAGKDNQKRSNTVELALLIIPCAMAFFFGIHCKQSSLESDLKKYRIENVKLSASLNDQNAATYVLNMIAKRSGMTTTAMAESLYINFRKAGGCTEEVARAELQKEKQNWPQS